MLEGKYNFKEEEPKWENFWLENGVYKFDQKDKTKKTFSIDTPPPTQSGNVHPGTAYGYAQADMVARFKRQMGFNVYYPLGFDNNGLATELLVEKTTGIKAFSVPREEFNKIAMDIVEQYNANFTEVFKRLAVSADRDIGYCTIDKHCQIVSQKSFIELAKQGIAYRDFKPVPWCTDCRTGVAALELEDREFESVFNYLYFPLADGSDRLEIATTRPEFLPACVAVFVNPNDEKRAKFVGKKVKVPLFNFEVEVLTDEKALLDKGTGAVMCCTYGDETDAEWQKKYNLPFKQAIDDGGRMTQLCGKYAGLKTTEARKQIIEDLKESGALYKQEPITHAVKTHERCHKPIEFLPKQSWFIKTSSDELKKIWLEQGEKIDWHPAMLKNRYDRWVENLNQDWNISRQRYFGIPFPVWYCKDCGEVIYADEADLPVNPLTSMPKHACPKCGSTNFEPESDVMDTWATSSLTPQINTKWESDPDYYSKMMPMDMRPCGRDIITTWDLRTIIKAYYHSKVIPWKSLMINGWVMQSKGVKFSKSQNNAAVSTAQLINDYSSDVVRYWTATGAYGRDIIFTFDDFTQGQRLVNKIWNASKFVLMFLENYAPKKPAKILSLDNYIMNKLNKVIDKIIAFYNEYEVGYAKEEIEKFFWDFCDNYIELVKNRLYKPEIFGEDAKESAQWACYNVLYRFLQLIGITMPHIAEEIYQAYFVKYENAKSIHSTIIEKIDCEENDDIISVGEEVCSLLAEVRGWKSKNNLSLKEQIENIDIYTTCPNEIEGMMIDLKSAGGIQNYTLIKSNEAKIEVK